MLTASWRSISRARAGVALVRCLSEVPASLQLSFSTPHEIIYKGKVVDRVTLPGAMGQFGITVGHSPIISELQPGVVHIVHEPGKEPEKYFVSGGFSLTHADSVAEVSVGEAVKLEDLDEAVVKTGYASFAAVAAAAAEGSAEKAEAQIGMSVHYAMAQALGITV